MKRILLLLLAVILSACANRVPTLQHQSQLADIGERASEFNVYVDQQTLTIFDANSSPYSLGITGLVLGAMLDEIKANNAERAAGALLDALSPLELADKLQHKMQTDIAYDQVPTPLQPRFVSRFDASAYPETVRNMLELRMRYGLSNSFDRMFIRLDWVDSDLLVRTSGYSQTTRHSLKPYLITSFTYVLGVPEHADDPDLSKREENAQAWLQWGTENIEKHLLLGMDDIVQLLNTDLKQADDLSFTGEIVTYDGIDNLHVDAFVFARQDDRVWAMSQQGYHVIEASAVLKSTSH